MFPNSAITGPLILRWEIQQIQNAIARDRFKIISSKIYFASPTKLAECSKTYYIDDVVNCLKATFQKCPDTDNESSNEESDIQPESDDQVGKENEFPEDFEDPTTNLLMKNQISNRKVMTKLAKKTNFQKTLRTPLVLLFYG
ncbi:hypothetical protein QE152_g37966 [Popillia japonica]|uniref:Uncharacterized protein n=1 Tax=Popillia japonica TaxID=7064 RepID=A0AAW1I8R1_POPJA